MEFLWFLSSIRNPVFDFFFGLITYFGDEIIFMAIAITLFWCVSKKDGYYILTVGFIGTILNQFLKLLFRIPRPWVLDESFKAVESAIEGAGGYSFPSGHTQSSVGTFGSIAHLYKNKAIRILSIILCVLVPFSRMYLGVHTPLDVFVSLGIALVLIFVLKPIFDKVYDSTKGMLIFIGVMALMALGFLLFVHLYPFENEVLSSDNYEHALKNAYTLLGALIGMAVALPLERKFVNFETKDKWYIQIVKVVLGLILVLGTKELSELALSPIFGGHPSLHAIRYFLVVLVAVFFYPMLFPLIRKLDEKIFKKKETEENAATQAK